MTRMSKPLKVNVQSTTTASDTWLSRYLVVAYTLETTTASDTWLSRYLVVEYTLETLQALVHIYIVAVNH